MFYSKVLIFCTGLRFFDFEISFEFVNIFMVIIMGPQGHIASGLDSCSCKMSNNMVI